MGTKTCRECFGRGQIEYDIIKGFGHRAHPSVEIGECYVCDGTGRVDDEPSEEE